MRSDWCIRSITSLVAHCTTHTVTEFHNISRYLCYVMINYIKGGIKYNIQSEKTKVRPNLPSQRDKLPSAS